MQSILFILVLIQSENLVLGVGEANRIASVQAEHVWLLEVWFIAGKISEKWLHLNIIRMLYIGKCITVFDLAEKQSFNWG